MKLLTVSSLIAQTFSKIRLSFYLVIFLSVEKVKKLFRTKLQHFIKYKYKYNRSDIVDDNHSILSINIHKQNLNLKLLAPLKGKH